MAGVLIKAGMAGAKAVAKKAAAKKAKKETVKEAGGKIKSQPKKTQSSGAKPKNQTQQGSSVTSPRASSHQGPVPGNAAKSTVALKQPLKTTGWGGVKSVKAGSTKKDYGTAYKPVRDEMKSAVKKTKGQLRANKKAKGIK